MSEQEDKKLTKKQLKALQFRKSKEEKEVEEKRKLEEADKPAQEGDQPPKKKRKTRRGRGGKGKKGTSGGNRFIVFVGGLPKDVTASELQVHFKSSGPDQIRLRADKGIAFLEFDGDKDQKGIQRRMDIALLQNKTLLREKRINVELTVGGGGNSQDRLEKLRKKNEKFEAERQERMQKLMSKPSKPTTQADGETPSTSAGGVHPDRAKLMK